MAQYVQNGNVIDYDNAGVADINYGDVIVGTDRIFIAAENIAIGESGGAKAVGVFEFDAINTVAFTVGQKVYWDDTAKKMTNESTDNTEAGFVIESKALDGIKCKVKIG